MQNIKHLLTSLYFAKERKVVEYEGIKILVNDDRVPKELRKKAKIENGFKDKICNVSGAGNVAMFTIEKLYALGAKPVTCTDSKGTIYDEKGIDCFWKQNGKYCENGNNYIAEGVRFSGNEADVRGGTA